MGIQQETESDKTHPCIGINPLIICPTSNSYESVDSSKWSVNENPVICYAAR